MSKFEENMQNLLRDVYDMFKNNPEYKGYPEPTIGRMTARFLNEQFNKIDKDHTWDISFITDLKEVSNG